MRIGATALITAAAGVLAAAMLHPNAPALAAVGQRPCSANALCANAPAADGGDQAAAERAIIDGYVKKQVGCTPNMPPHPVSIAWDPPGFTPGSAALASFTMPTRRWAGSTAPTTSTVDGASSTCTADGDGLLPVPGGRCGAGYPCGHKFGSIRLAYETGRGRPGRTPAPPEQNRQVDRRSRPRIAPSGPADSGDGRRRQALSMGPSQLANAYLSPCSKRHRR